MARKIVITEQEHFCFCFIGNHEGKGIPLPLPKPVVSLCEKGLVQLGCTKCGDKQTCYLTPLGKACFGPRERSINCV